MVGENPFLGPQWEPIAKVIAQLLERAKGRDTFQIQTYGKRYGASPYTSPFVQGRWDIGIFEIELASNLALVPQLTDYEQQMLEFYGWDAPEVSPEEYRDSPSANPNYTRYFTPEYSVEEIVEFILTTLVTVHQITEDDFWGVSTKATADFIDSMGLLGRLKYSDGNPDRVIFALPGHHKDLVDK